MISGRMVGQVDRLRSAGLQDNNISIAVARRFHDQGGALWGPGSIVFLSRRPRESSQVNTVQDHFIQLGIAVAFRIKHEPGPIRKPERCAIPGGIAGESTELRSIGIDDIDLAIAIAV